MGKSKTNRGQDEDESHSEAGTAGCGRSRAKSKNKKAQKNRKGGSSEDEDYEPSVSTFFDALTEKRTATREAAYVALQELVRREVESDEIEERAEELAMLIFNSVKKGNPREATLAADLLCLLFISLQSTCQVVFDLAEEALQAIAKTHKSELVKGKICQALSMGAFALGQDSSDTALLMTWIQGLMLDKRATHELIVPALSAWTLLASSLSDGFIFDRLRRLLGVLDEDKNSLLEHDHVDVRVAAAEAAAVIYEATWRYSPDQAKEVLSEICACEAEEEAVAAHVPRTEDQRSEFERLAAKVEALELLDSADAQEVKDLLADFDEADLDLDLMPKAAEAADATASGAQEDEEDGAEVTRGLKRSGSLKSMKHAHRVKDRTSVRMARATMEGGTGVPMEKIKVRGATIDINTWRRRTWLHALRAPLQAGLQAHLSGNSFLHEVFGIDAESANMSSLEMRQEAAEQRRVRAGSCLSQQRDMRIDRARRLRQEMCNQPHLADDTCD